MIYVGNKFRPDLQVKPKNLRERLRFFFLGGNQFWETTDDLSIELVDLNGKKMTFFLDAGFVHDFASIPKLLHGIIPPWGRHGPAAILHDAFYRGLFHISTRKEADDLFLQAMEQLEVGRLRRNIMHFFVRIFGGFCTKTWG